MMERCRGVEGGCVLVYGDSRGESGCEGGCGQGRAREDGAVRRRLW